MYAKTVSFRNPATHTSEGESLTNPQEWSQHFLALLQVKQNWFFFFPPTGKIIGYDIKKFFPLIKLTLPNALFKSLIKY